MKCEQIRCKSAWVLKVAEYAFPKAVDLKSVHVYTADNRSISVYQSERHSDCISFKYSGISKFSKIERHTIGMRKPKMTFTSER